MDVTRVQRLDPGVVIETLHATLRVTRDDEEASPERELRFVLHDGRSYADYSSKAPGAPAQRDVEWDPLLRGNAFRPLHDSARALAAMISVAAGRRMESGPESERVFVAMRGGGLVFLQNGDTLRYGVGDAVVVPAGEPVRLWAQGPEDALLVVVQPRMDAAPRRTLAGELARLKASAAEADTRTGP